MKLGLLLQNLPQLAVQQGISVEQLLLAVLDDCGGVGLDKFHLLLPVLHKLLDQGPQPGLLLGEAVEVVALLPENALQAEAGDSRHQAAVPAVGRVAQGAVFLPVYHVGNHGVDHIDFFCQGDGLFN